MKLIGVIILIIQPLTLSYALAVLQTGGLSFIRDGTLSWFTGRPPNLISL